MANLGVILFFVLSGYLISYLLQIEKSEFSKIDLPKFYIRRILRIWPIYYVIILICCILLMSNQHFINFPEINIHKTILFYSLFISNIAYGLGLTFPLITPLWSVGTEEQFYLFWPLLVNHSKKIITPSLIIFILFNIMKFFAHFIINKIEIDRIVNVIPFDIMAIGGIGAYLVYTKSKFLNYFYNPIIQIIAWGVLLESIFIKPFHLASIIDTDLNAFFYLIIIINVSSNKKTIINLEHKIFDFIGKISYGIYVYHLTVITLVSYIFRDIIKYKVSNSVFDYLLYYSIMIILTITVSSLSHIYFESYFLKFKYKFSKIHSVNSINK